jgi:hypothetical protein
MQAGSYKKLVDERRRWYKSIGKVFCPCLSEDVHFNFKGFYHLLYKGTGERRSIAVTSERMDLLPLSPSIISSAIEFKEYRQEYSKRLNKIIHSWELLETVGGVRVSVILRRIGNGKIIFYSIWKNKK